MIDRLPSELITYVGELCTVEQHRKRLGIRLGIRASPRSRWRTGDLNRLARTCQHLYQMLNPLLYRTNLEGDVPLNSCVLWAAQKGRLGTIQTARRYGADLDANGVGRGMSLNTAWSDVPGRLKYFATPLHIALQNGHEQIVKYLLDNAAGVHIESRNFCNCPAAAHTPFPYALHTAIYHSRVPGATEMLIRRGGAYLVAENAPAIPILSRRGANELVEILLENEEPQALAIALRHAIETGNQGLFTDILKKPGIDVSAADEMGKSALHFAVNADSSFFVKSLLELSEVNISARDTLGRTPVHYAAENGGTEVLAALLRHPACDAAAVDEERKTPLHYAAASSVVDVVTLLLQRPETDVTALDLEDETALHHAARSPNQEPAVAIIQQLVDHGVPIDHVGEHGTALQLASRSQLCQNAAVLLSCGADAIQSDNAPGGWTVLHHILRFPAGSRQTEVVATLIDKGVGLDVVADDDDYYEADVWDGDDFRSDCTPLFLAAVGAKNVGCMKLLLAAGANHHMPVISRCTTSLFREEGRVEPGDAEAFLAAMFRHLWDQKPISEDDVEAAAERIRLLLEHGASIDRGPGRYSALHYACKYATGGFFPLLELVLKNASRQHVSLKHLEELISLYKGASSSPDVTETIRRLVRFADDVYPERIEKGMVSNINSAAYHSRE